MGFLNNWLSAKNCVDKSNWNDLNFSAKIEITICILKNLINWTTNEFCYSVQLHYSWSLKKVPHHTFGVVVNYSPIYTLRTMVIARLVHTWKAVKIPPNYHHNFACFSMRWKTHWPKIHFSIQRFSEFVRTKIFWHIRCVEGFHNFVSLSKEAFVVVVSKAKESYRDLNRIFGHSRWDEKPPFFSHHYDQMFPQSFSKV